jgi:hypothetical protein
VGAWDLWHLLDFGSFLGVFVKVGDLRGDLRGWEGERALVDLSILRWVGGDCVWIGFEKNTIFVGYFFGYFSGFFFVMKILELLLNCESAVCE